MGYIARLWCISLLTHTHHKLTLFSTLGGAHWALEQWDAALKWTLPLQKQISTYERFQLPEHYVYAENFVFATLHLKKIILNHTEGGWEGQNKSAPYIICTSCRIYECSPG